jgi:hypothetical protein
MLLAGFFNSPLIYIFCFNLFSLVFNQHLKIILLPDIFAPAMTPVREENKTPKIKANPVSFPVV